MATRFTQLKRRGRLPLLNVTIGALNLAKEISNVTPATAVFGSVSVLLTMIKVDFPLLCEGEPPVHNYSGFRDQRTRLRRPRITLR